MTLSLAMLCGAVVSGNLHDEIGTYTSPIVPVFNSLPTPLMTNVVAVLDVNRKASAANGLFASFCVGGLYRVDFGDVKSELIMVPLHDTNTYQYVAMRDNATNVTLAAAWLNGVMQTNISYVEVTNSPWADTNLTTMMSNSLYLSIVAATNGFVSASQTNISYTVVTNAPWLQTNGNGSALTGFTSNQLPGISATGIVSGTLQGTLIPTSVTNGAAWLSANQTFSGVNTYLTSNLFNQSVMVSNSTSAAGVQLNTNGTIKATGAITTGSTISSGGAIKATAGEVIATASGSSAGGSSGDLEAVRSGTAGALWLGSDGNCYIFRSSGDISVPSTITTFTMGSVASSLKSVAVTAASTIQTNNAGFNFFPANPGNWVTALNTRTTNGVRRATLEVDISFTDAVGGTPVAQVVIEHQGVITNTWISSMPGGISSTVTNHYFYRLTTNSVVNITDISRGTGASVGISQSQLTSE